jgi:hypothetical protein
VTVLTPLHRTTQLIEYGGSRDRPRVVTYPWRLLRDTIANDFGSDTLHRNLDWLNRNIDYSHIEYDQEIHFPDDEDDYDHVFKRMIRIVTTFSVAVRREEDAVLFRLFRED